MNWWKPSTHPGLTTFSLFCFVGTIYYTFDVNHSKAGFLLFEAKSIPLMQLGDQDFNSGNAIPKPTSLMTHRTLLLLSSLWPQWPLSSSKPYDSSYPQTFALPCAWRNPFVTLQISAWISPPQESLSWSFHIFQTTSVPSVAVFREHLSSVALTITTNNYWMFVFRAMWSGHEVENYVSDCT